MGAFFRSTVWMHEFGHASSSKKLKDEHLAVSMHSYGFSVGQFKSPWPRPGLQRQSGRPILVAAFSLTRLIRSCDFSAILPGRMRRGLSSMGEAASYSDSSQMHWSGLQ